MTTLVTSRLITQDTAVVHSFSIYMSFPDTKFEFFEELTISDLNQVRLTQKYEQGELIRKKGLAGEIISTLNLDESQKLQ